MTLNEVFLEGKVESAPEVALSDSHEPPEIVIRSEGRCGRVDYFTVQCVEHIRYNRPAVGDWVVVVGSLAQKQRVEPATGEIRYEVTVEGKELRKLKAKSIRDL